MEQFLLTDVMIHNSFEKTGIDMKYFAVYEAEAKRCFQSLQGECPDDEDTTEDDNNALSSLALTDDYINPTFTAKKTFFGGESWVRSIFLWRFLHGCFRPRLVAIYG